MAYSRMHLEINQKRGEGNGYPTGVEKVQVSHLPRCLSDVGDTSIPVCAGGNFLPGVFNLCALETIVPLYCLYWTSSLLVPPPPLSSPSVLLLPAYWSTNKTGPILHSMPSWPCGGVSVITTSLLFSLRAVVP